MLIFLTISRGFNTVYRNITSNNSYNCVFHVVLISECIMKSINYTKISIVLCFKFLFLYKIKKFKDHSDLYKGFSL